MVKFRKGNGIYPYINTVFSTFGELLLAVSNEKLVIRAQTIPVKNSVFVALSLDSGLFFHNN